MSSIYVKCKCGGELEMKALGVREFEMPRWWIELHAACFGKQIVKPGESATPEGK